MFKNLIVPFLLDNPDTQGKLTSRRNVKIAVDPSEGEKNTRGGGGLNCVFFLF